MARSTGATAVATQMAGAAAIADRVTDALWLAALPKPRIARTVDRLPATTRPRVEPAEGTVSGLPGAVTDMAVSADGRSLVLAHYGDDAVSAVDTATLALTAVVAGVAEPFALTVADRAYVSSAAIDGDSVVAVDLELGMALADRALNTAARGLAAAPAGDVVYVARCGDDVADIVAVDVTSGRMTVIPVARGAGATVDAVRTNADATRLYATLHTAAGSAVAVVDTRARRVVQTIAVRGSIGDIAVHREGRRVFATCWDDERGGAVTVIDAGTGRVVNTVAVSGMPTQVALSASRAYVAHGDGISVLDIAAGRIVDTVETDRPVSCLAVNPEGTRLYIADFEGTVVARAVSAADPRLRAAS